MHSSHVLKARKLSTPTAYVAWPPAIAVNVTFLQRSELTKHEAASTRYVSKGSSSVGLPNWAFRRGF
jgi:hypothetical protein